MASASDRVSTPLPAELLAVIDMTMGVGPAVIAGREQVPEATLYAWRNAAFAGALRALEAGDRRP